jgi:hypothetical protein
MLQIDTKEDASRVVFSPDGGFIAGFASHMGVTVCEIGTRQVVFHCPTHASAVAFSPDGRLLVIGDLEGNLEWWDLSTKKKALTRRYGNESYRHLSFSPAGNVLASASQDDTSVLLWDAKIKPAPPENPELNAEKLRLLVAKLAADQAPAAEEASWQLALAGKEVDDFLKKELRLPAARDPKEVAKLVRELDSADAEKRGAAVQELAGLGIEAEEALSQAGRNAPSKELARRVDELLALTHDKPLSGKAMLQIRIVRMLERRATPSAVELLRTVAKGPAEAPQVQQARASLDRLHARKTESADRDR